MLKTKEEIIVWLDKYGVENYTINEDLTVNVNDSVNLIENNLKSIDVQFNVVSRNFFCNNNQLTSLEGCPKEIGGVFWCHDNELLGELQEIEDFNEIKKILDIKKHKKELEGFLIKNFLNKKMKEKIKI